MMLRQIRIDFGRTTRTAGASLTLALSLTSAVYAVPPGDIVLGDITVMRLTTPVGNTTVEQRASLVQDRINQAIAIPNVTEKAVHVVMEKAGPTIYVEKIRIVTIDPGTAAAEGVTPIVLAKTWAHRLMGVIAQVCIRVPVTPPANTPEIAAAPGTAAAGKADPATAVASASATPPATTAASPATPTSAPASVPTPSAAPTTPATPALAAPAQPAKPAAPVDPGKPAAPAAPANPPAPPVAPANPPTPPAAPANPPTPPSAA